MWDLDEYFWQFVNPRKKFSHSSIVGVFRGHKTQYFSLVLRQTPAVSSRKNSIFLLKHVFLLVDLYIYSFEYCLHSKSQKLKTLTFKNIYRIFPNIPKFFQHYLSISKIFQNSVNKTKLLLWGHLNFKYRPHLRFRR